MTMHIFKTTQPRRCFMFYATLWIENPLFGTTSILVSLVYRTMLPASAVMHNFECDEKTGEKEKHFCTT